MILKKIAIRLVAFILLNAVLVVPSAYAEYLEGRDYVELPGEAEIHSNGQIEVNEFFWFGCPGCFRFESTIQHWVANEKPEAVRFVPVPATVADRWLFHAKVYYAFELTNTTDELYTKFFDEIHVKNNRIRSEDQLAEWLDSVGANTQEILSALNSFGAVTKVNQADLLARKYQITGVPTLVVGGKYRTSPSMIKSDAESLKVVEFLVNKILQENSGS